MNIKKFNETIDVLVKAYLNGTLEHSLCSACAVGNIVAHSRGTTQVRLKEPKLLLNLQEVHFENNVFSDGSSAFDWWSAMTLFSLPYTCSY